MCGRSRGTVLFLVSWVDDGSRVIVTIFDSFRGGVVLRACCSVLSRIEDLVGGVYVSFVD
jgi:hypothetical protein